MRSKKREVRSCIGCAFKIISSYGRRSKRQEIEEEVKESVFVWFCPVGFWFYFCFEESGRGVNGRI